MSEAARTFLATCLLFYRTVPLPRRCVYCDGKHIVRDGSGTRTASVVADGDVEHLAGIPIRRVRCQCCRVSWRLRPPGVMPHRHYQLCVVVRGVVPALFEGRSLTWIARHCRCSVWTVARWIRWLAGVASPADLVARLCELAGSPVFPHTRSAVRVARADQAVRSTAAAVVSVLEAIGTAAGREPPALRSVVEAVVDNRARYTTYASPRIPDFARIGLGGRLGRLTM